MEGSMRKTIIWIIQSNQITPIIAEYLATLRMRIEQYIDLQFFVPDESAEVVEKIKNLDPVVFPTSTQTARSPEEAFSAKRAELAAGTFEDGLSFADVLLLDDLGGGQAARTLLNIERPKHLCGIILQIPSPLGSSDMEERIYHAAILWARQHQIPCIGYELLPLDTRWILAASLPDGVITRHGASYEFLQSRLPHENIWTIPWYEGGIFTSNAARFHINGVKASYHYRNVHKVHPGLTVLYLPHNVAMLYEYRKLIEILQPFGKELHLMFTVGKDQIRGSYSHQEMIEMTCKKELAHFASFSFHSMDSPWEMLMADAVVACSGCFHTQVSHGNIPGIIFDPYVPPMSWGDTCRVALAEELLARVETLINERNHTHEMADILMLLTTLKHP